jgi:hypothetical protein
MQNTRAKIDVKFSDFVTALIAAQLDVMTVPAAAIAFSLQLC